MLPAAISEEAFSLNPDETRPAILCQLQIAASGEILEAKFAIAIVRSHARLTYSEVDRLLDSEAAPNGDAEVLASLLALQAASAQMKYWRSERQQLARERSDFRFKLNDKGRIDSFSPISRGQSQVIVEECMVAVNQAAGTRLAAAGCGIFATHAGFRTERLADVQALFEEAGYPCSPKQLNTLEGFHAAMLHLRKHPGGDNLQEVLSRFLQRGVLSASAKPHIGLGAESYATSTSPLRRYADLYNHRQLKALIREQSTRETDTDLVDALANQLKALRSASQWAERWLHSDYLTRHRQTLKQQLLPATVVQVNPLGLIVRLRDTGIEGLVERRSLGAGMKLDPKKLVYANKKQSLQLGDPLSVKLGSVRKDQREILFQWVPETEEKSKPVEPAPAAPQTTPETVAGTTATAAPTGDLTDLPEEQEAPVAKPETAAPTSEKSP